jgi:transposase
LAKFAFRLALTAHADIPRENEIDALATHSDDCFAQAFPAEKTEGLLEGHVRAFQYVDAVPARILYDNTTLAVARILGDGERQKTCAFSELQSH